MDEDIPKTTIAVLLVLTVVISIASTWVVLDKSMTTEVVYTTGPGQAGGQVKIGIGTGGEEPSALPAPITGEVASNVAIKIL